MKGPENLLTRRTSETLSGRLRAHDFQARRVKTDRMFQRSSFRFRRRGRRPASKALAVVRTEPRRRAAGTKPEQDGQTELASSGCALSSLCEMSRHLCQSPVGRGLEAGERPPGGLCPALPSPWWPCGMSLCEFVGSASRALWVQGGVSFVCAHGVRLRVSV